MPVGIGTGIWYAARMAWAMAWLVMAGSAAGRHGMAAWWQRQQHESVKERKEAAMTAAGRHRWRLPESSRRGERK